MDQQLEDVLSGNVSNYLLPFLWVADGGRERLPGQIESVWESGARAFCVESRVHQNFCQEEWWADMEVILKEAQKREMKVWLLDDKRFPTGYSNGLAAQKYPERRKWQLIERHVDLIGPQEGCGVLLDPRLSEDECLGVFLYRRTGEEEALTGTPIDLCKGLKNGMVFFDLPEGCFRLFAFYKTRKGVSEGEKDYISLIDPDSVDVLLEAVYQSHFERFGEYFGNTFAGFFSDEPSLGNIMFNGSVPNPGRKNWKVGMPGLALPWSDALMLKMETALPYLGALWYPYEGISEELRFLYMDELTKLYRDSFSRKLGCWCRAHGVCYIGHIIEDMNAHARLGCSAGHYFRALDGQDMSGMDIVLHQIRPGFAHLKSSAGCMEGMVDPEFYHYVLSKMCSSMAHLTPHMEGRAMCEVFGAYGWAEDVPMMKWLMDHLLVRGVNYFVPHAFSFCYPNPDCPPHFFAEGNDPQFPGFQKLMRYTNHMSHLLLHAKSTARIGIFYHGELEWANGDKAMLMQKPAKALMDQHIDFEILPLDAITQFGSVQDGALRVNGISFTCLLIPYAPIFPKAVVETLCDLEAQGVLVLTVVEGAVRPASPFPEIPLERLGEKMESLGLRALNVSPQSPLLRISHWKRGALEIYMLFNEALTPMENRKVRLPSSGSYLEADLLNDRYDRGFCEEGSLTLSFAPYQSKLFLFGEDFSAFPASSALRELPLTIDGWTISLQETGLQEDWSLYKRNGTLENLSPIFPDFSGIVRYEGRFSLNLSENIPYVIDLGEISQVARVSLNGEDLGIRICPPHRFPLGNAVRDGENSLVIEAANTLANRLKDPFSSYLSIPPFGLLGPVTFYTLS